MFLERLQLEDGTAFDVTLLARPASSRVVLFAPGRGGDPARHQPLLEALHAGGATVIAPHGELFLNPRPTAEQLLERARRSLTAVQVLAPTGVPLHGVGHSIGASLLLAAAGAEAWLSAEQPLRIPELELETLSLFAPALGFFQVPGAALRLRSRKVWLWHGTADALCPRANVDFTLEQLGSRGELRLLEGAGHFSFMHVLPPNALDPLVDRAAVLDQITRATCADVASGAAPASGSGSA